MTATPAPALTAAELAVVQAFEDAPVPPEIAEAAVAQKRVDDMAASPQPPNGPGQGDAHPMAHGMADGMAHPIAHPPVVVAGAVVGAGVVAPTPPKPPKSEGGSHVSRGSASAPPLFPDHCDEHADDPVPGKCGDCADARKARRVLSVVSPANPAMVPHCGECDETRHRETPFGVIRCPECHPRAEESA